MVDFMATSRGRPTLLIDVATTITPERVAILETARREARPDACFFITLDSAPVPKGIPNGIGWYSAANWLLVSDET
jgi:hypothetical protein